MPAPQEVQNYLIRIMGLNPFYDSDKIIEMRSSFLGLNNEINATKAAPRRSTEDVAVAQEILDHVRSMFWGASQVQMKQQLQSLDLSGKPELAAAVKRLTNVISLRPEFPKLSQKPYNYPPLFQYFKSIVVMPPREAGLARERALQALRSTGDRRKMRTMILALQKHHPELYQLEADWFSNLNRIKKAQSRTAQSQSSFSFNVPRWLLVLVIIFGLRTCSAVSRYSREPKVKPNALPVPEDQRKFYQMPINQ